MVLQIPLSVGHDDDLEKLYRDEGPRLWRALVAYTCDPEVANDAVAEAFAQALGRGDELHSPMRWVWRAAFRIAAGDLKDRGRRGGQAAADPLYQMPDAPAALVSALEQLSPKQRSALVLYYYAGYSTAEVASILGSSAATVRVHLSKGRKRLRQLLEDDHA